MNRFFYIWTFIAFAFLAEGCDNDSMAIFSSQVPSVDERYDKSMFFNDKNGFPTLTVKDDEYNIYVCTDTHLKETSNNFRKFIQLYHEDKDCPAAVHLGDLVESDASYDLIIKALEETPASPSKKDTMFVTLGNHDIFYSQWYNYTQYWPTSTYYFVVQSQGKKKAKDLYICLDSAQGKIGLKQMKWLRDILHNNAADFRHVIVFTHVNLFRRENTSADISTTSLEETYELMGLFSTYQVKQFWSGHDHSREEFTEGGVKYIIVDSMEDNNPEAAYMILHVGEQLNNTFHFINTTEVD